MVKTLSKNIQEILAAAQKHCANEGCRLTPKRQRMLELLLRAESPLSAYELTDLYNKLTNADIKAMSVYRILDVLESVNLVHRLHSANKYIACTHASGRCHHHLSLFLICKICQKVQITDLDNEMGTPIVKRVSNLGFKQTSPLLEVNGVCEECLARTCSTSTGNSKGEICEKNSALG